MKTKKKILLYAVIFLSLLSLLFGFFWLRKKKGAPRETDSWGMAGYAKELKNIYHANIYVYGDDAAFPEEFVYTRLTEISKASLMAGEQYGYGAIVILDLSGRCMLTDEALLALREFSETERYDILYFGRSLLDDLVRLGFVKKVQEDECGLLYRVSCVGEEEPNELGNPYACHGIFLQEDMEFCQEKPDYVLYRALSELQYLAQEAAKFRETGIEE